MGLAHEYPPRLTFRQEVLIPDHPMWFCSISEFVRPPCRLPLSLYVIPFSSTHVITHLFKLIECLTLRVNPIVNYGLEIMMCQSRFINQNKCTTLVGNVDNGEGLYTCGGRGYVGNLCTFCSILLQTYNCSKK